MTTRYYLSECLLIRDENRYLLEHLERNAQAGIEHFFIYDNRSAEPVADFLATNAPEWLERCTITPLDLAPEGYCDVQLDCYRLFRHWHGSETRWCAFIDTDEMFTGDLRALCEQTEREGYRSLRFIQLVHGGGGQQDDAHGSLFERFGHHVTDYYMHKVVVQTEWIGCQYAHDTLFTRHLDPMNVKIIPRTDSAVQLHHFLFRSLAEWKVKQQRGRCRADGHYDTAEWLKYNKLG